MRRQIQRQRQLLSEAQELVKSLEKERAQEIAESIEQEKKIAQEKAEAE